MKISEIQRKSQNIMEENKKVERERGGQAEGKRKEKKEISPEYL